MKDGLKIFISKKDAERLGEEIFFSEHLRYAELVTRPQSEKTLHGIENWYFVIGCPRGLTVKVWAEQNIGRLRSFGIKAERC